MVINLQVLMNLKQVYYMQYFRRRMDFGTLNSSYHKIRERYMLKKYLKKER